MTALQWAALWTVVEWQDGLGNWHVVEEWQDTLDRFSDSEGYKVWWVAEEDLGKGPFRWVIYQQQAGPQIATSDLFHLPTTDGQTVQVEVTLALPAAAGAGRPTALVAGAGGAPPGQTSAAISVIVAGAEDGGNWVDNRYTAHTAGMWTVRGSYNGHTVNVVLKVNTGELNYIVLSPLTATVTAGYARAYLAHAFDAYGNPLGDVTANTNFHIVEGGDEGSWTSSLYTARTAGTWTVRGSYNGTVADAQLMVEPAWLSHIVVSPRAITATAGTEQAYTAEAFDVYGNSLGDVTGDTSFSIMEQGHNSAWMANLYTAHTAGTWTVRGLYEGRVDQADLTVEPAGPSYVVVAPRTATVTAGDRPAFTTAAFDAYDNSLGDVTEATAFRIVEDGHGGGWDANRYAAHTAGTWTVRGAYEGLTDDVALAVKPAGLSYIVLSPGMATVTAGHEQVYAATAFDAYDNVLDDVTAATIFNIVESGHNGRWAHKTYTAHTAGGWTVRGTYRGLTVDASLRVEPGELSYIVVTPNTAAVAAGNEVAFAAEAFDAYGNSLGDVTADTTFDIVMAR